MDWFRCFHATKNLLVIIFTLSVSCAQAGSGPALKLKVGSSEQSFSLGDLNRVLGGKLTTLEVASPPYNGKRMRYEGYWLKDVLTAGGLKKSAKVDELAFHCADGFTPTLTFEKLSKLELFLAVREKENPNGWTPVRQGKKFVSPAPFYVLGANKASYEAFPWPYQVVKIEAIQFKEKYALLYPKGVKQQSQVFLGFEKFRSQCLSCHSINLQGAAIGPELNIPKNITEYRTVRFLKKFIKDPHQFRARSPMPPSKLSSKELKQVIAYLKYMRRHKDFQKLRQ